MSAPQPAADRNPGLILRPSLLRFRHRLVTDEQFLLALTLAVGAIVIALVGGEATIGLVALAGLLFVAAQGSIAIMAGPSRRRRADTRPAARQVCNRGRVRDGLQRPDR